MEKLSTGEASAITHVLHSSIGHTGHQVDEILQKKKTKPISIQIKEGTQPTYIILFI